MMGIGYVIEHYIAYFKKEQEEKAFKIYITDGIKAIAENTAKVNGGSYLNARFLDVIEPGKEEKRTADEVIDSLKEKLGRL